MGTAINKIKSKKNWYSAVYSTDSEALGERIKWGRRNDTDKFLSVFLKVSTVLVSTTSTGRLFHREGAATQNARLASSVRVLVTIRRGVLEGRSVRDGMWSFGSELRYGGDDIRWALNVRVATLCLNHPVSFVIYDIRAFWCSECPCQKLQMTA